MAQFDQNRCLEKLYCPFNKKIDTFQSEYGEIINASEISIGIDKIYDVWN